LGWSNSRLEGLLAPISSLKSGQIDPCATTGLAVGTQTGTLQVQAGRVGWRWVGGEIN